MIERGDVRLADVRDERRRAVLVVSDDRFHRASGRVLVAPEIPVDSDQEQFPWRIAVGRRVFALDLLRNVQVESVLERLERAPAAVREQARRAVRAIT